jgi:hypothetical protein
LLAATEMNDSSGTLRVCQTRSTMGDLAESCSNSNTSTARFMTSLMLARARVAPPRLGRYFPVFTDR